MLWFTKNNLILLRLHFSLFLLPVFLFALSRDPLQTNSVKAWLLFFILHFLVYPASNAYNSFMDRDETPIGGLRNPPKAGKSLFYLTILLDALACFLSLFIGWLTLFGILLYILASRAYSYRGIRLKRYPVWGFLTVFVFQGGFTYLLTCFSVLEHPGPVEEYLFAALASSFLIGGIYPLTQIYQHQADLQDDVVTLSYKLGYRGTFLFCAASFVLSMACMFLHFRQRGNLNHFMLIQLFLLPVVIYFVYWFWKVIQDISNANFEYTMRMNLIASFCMNACFLSLFFY